MRLLLKITIASIIIFSTIVAYSMYLRKSHLKHMEMARMVNEKINSGKYYKLNVNKMHERSPGLITRVMSWLSPRRVDWNKYIVDQKTS